MSQNSVLIVEDSASLRRIYTQYLANDGAEIEGVGTVAAAKAALEARSFAVVLLDLRLPDGDGFEVLQTIVDRRLNSLVIIMTAHGSIGMAVDAIRLGAFDFLEKPFDARRLKVAINSAFIQVQKLGFAQGDAEQEEIAAQRTSFHSFIGGSQPMQELYQLIERAGPSKASVFVTGESGTGKELTAEALHKQSARADGPFVALNCAAIPKDLMESEIFGHLKGAFTGASSTREGAASKADGGTLFLDEIGELSIDLQTKLLRFIQSGVVQKVGSNTDEVVDVRFVCATNRDPLAEVKAGRFREDLYYRLHVIPMHLPPLRERGDDILLIADYFLNKYSREESKFFEGLSDEVKRLFRSYEWPGNVRQLQNVIRNVVVLHPGGLIDVAQLPAPLNGSKVKTEQATIDSPQAAPRKAKPVSKTGKATGKLSLAKTVGEIRPLADIEREIIENAIDLCEGNVPKAAALLEVSPSTLYRKKQNWD